MPITNVTGAPPKVKIKREATMPLDNRPRCEDTIHCETVNEDRSVCESNGCYVDDFHETFCMTDPNRPYASYRLSFYCPECGHNWQELLCEECVIEGPPHWGYFPGNTIPCPECTIGNVPIPKVERL